jgi:helicase
MSGMPDGDGSAGGMFFLSGLRLWKLWLKIFAGGESMKLKDLGRYGIPESVLAAWQSRQGEYLLPLQEKAVRFGILDDKRGEGRNNLLITAPTSAGKSFCGEIAAIGALMHRRKAVMLVPLKSIAEEKYNYYRRCYDDIGIKIIVASGDHPENDHAFESGDFDLALAIYEKFNRLLTINPAILRQLGLVIVDEMQMLSDPERGAELEMALTKTIITDAGPRIIALSAVLDDEKNLAQWLEAEVIREANRPVDLLLGVICNGHFKFRSFNSGLEGEEKIEIGGGGDLTEATIELLKKDDSRKLVFLKSRRDTINAAFKLAASSGWSPARETIANLEGEEPSFLIRALRQTLSRGVAFHNADLTPSQRTAIEQGYLSGEIKIIFTTTTLAMGVNLPAELVLLETMKYSDSGTDGKAALVPITVAEFQNIAGRAGRFRIGRNIQSGRAAIMADSDFEYEVLWSGYIDAPRGERLESVLKNREFDDILLDFVVYENGTRKITIENLLNKTFFHFCGDSYDAAAIKNCLEKLSQLALLRPDHTPTPVGLVSAGSGITVQIYGNYRRLLDIRYPETLLGWLFLALSGGRINPALIGLSRLEFYNRSYEKLLYQRYDNYINELDLYAERQLGRETLDFRTAAILKAVFLLTEWADGADVESLEPRYQLHHGQIISLADTAGWLIGSLARLIEANEADSPVAARLDEYAFRVQFGIEPEMNEIYYRMRRILNRKDYKILAQHEIRSLRDLVSAGSDKLAEFIKPESKLARVIQEIDNLNEEDKMQNQINLGNCPVKTGHQNPVNFSSRFGAYPARVELDGRYEGERYLIIIDGFPIRLTGKSFKYLVKLAHSRLTNNDGWIYKDDIEVGFNQARYLYRLKQEINHDGGSPWPVFENNRLGYYRLDLEPSKISLNFDNLREHPDYELRQIAERFSPRQAG